MTTNRIRRDSMEQLKIINLDIMVSSTSKHNLSPPTSKQRKRRRHVPPESHNLQRYGFLCDRRRQETDPLYAATPMFKVIPSLTVQNETSRLLGCILPMDIIKPVSNNLISSVQSNFKQDHDAMKQEFICHGSDLHGIDSISNKKNSDVFGGVNDVESSSDSNDDGIDDIIHNNDDIIDDENDNKQIAGSFFNSDRQS